MLLDTLGEIPRLTGGGEREREEKPEEKRERLHDCIMFSGYMPRIA